MQTRILFIRSSDHKRNQTEKSRERERERGYEVVVKQQSYCLREPWQLKRFLDASIYPLLEKAAEHGRGSCPRHRWAREEKQKNKGADRNDAKQLREGEKGQTAATTTNASCSAAAAGAWNPSWRGGQGLCGEFIVLPGGDGEETKPRERRNGENLEAVGLWASTNSSIIHKLGLSI